MKFSNDHCTIELIHGDCMEALEGMEENQFDLAIVDPPYGIGDNWSKSRSDRFYLKGKLHSYQNKTVPDREYFNQLKRVSKNQIIWGANYYTHNLPEDNHWIIWDKKRNVEKTFMSECELAWHSFSSPARIVVHEWDGARKGPETGKCNKVHPHQKPVALYKWLLKNYAKEGNTILDTHFGSLSIGIACADMGFSLTAYEIDIDYFNAACKRLYNHLCQQTLFKERPEVLIHIDNTIVSLYEYQQNEYVV